MESSPKFDLHLHSYFSDGTYSPRQIVQKCKNKELKIIALTDHENVGGVSEAVATGNELGIEVIPGIEFATSFKREEHHIIGYGIDYQSEKLRLFLEEWRKTKVAQLKKIIKKLQGFGFRITFEETEAQARGSIGRPHINWAIFQNRENLAVLKKYKIETQKDFFKKFLLEKPLGDGLAYVDRKRPQIGKVIDLIQELGGMAFWAHPFWRSKNISEIRKRVTAFRKLGLGGIEICYPFHNQEQTIALYKICEDLLMFSSAGSDFHGLGDKRRKIAGFQTFGIEINFPFQKIAGGKR